MPDPQTDLIAEIIAAIDREIARLQEMRDSLEPYVLLEAEANA